jgi:hypothetical protein
MGFGQVPSPGDVDMDKQFEEEARKLERYQRTLELLLILSRELSVTALCDPRAWAWRNNSAVCRSSRYFYYFGILYRYWRVSQKVVAPSPSGRGDFYDTLYWALGKQDRQRQPRWSLIRDVLHRVEE